MSPQNCPPDAGMSPRSLSQRASLLALLRKLGPILLMAVFCLTTSTADAQRRRKRNAKKKKPVATVKKVKRKGGAKDQVFDFTGLSLGASMRTPQLLYFLDRASEELQRASLQRRSFVPEMVRSISEEGL